MRTLLLTRGIQGAGKSSWIESNGLKQYTLSADDIRLLYQSPVIADDGSQTISAKNDGKVWKTLFELLESRMQRGEFTVVDATHSKNEMINQYKNLAKQYRYRVVVVDFSDVSLETAKKRNKMRSSYKFVPEMAIENAFERIVNDTPPSWVTVIKPDEFESYIEELSKPIDFSGYSKIHHIGDVHGCYDALMEFIDKNGGLKDDELYIFTGDYVDRGIQNGEVMDYLLTIYEKPNVIMLEGNHEIHLWNYANDLEIKSKEFANKTIPQIKHINKKELRQFYRKLRQLVYYTYHDEVKVLVTHGGLPKMPKDNLVYIATEQLIKGVGDYGLDIDNIWQENELGSKNIQVHGHRNIFRLPLFDSGINPQHSINLEGQVEFGRHLRIYTLQYNERFDTVGADFVEVKNEAYDKNARKKNENVRLKSDLTTEEMIDYMLNHKYVKESFVTENISSFNFTQEAFKKGKWDDISVKARGLFVNKNTKEIVSRSYDKFFNANEQESTKLNTLADNLKFPVRIYDKPNGYLGILGYDSESDKLLFSSKSQAYGIHAEWFEGLFIRQFNHEQLEDLKDFLKEENLTLTFEVILKDLDPHIIKYDSDQLILLDAIKRTVDFEKLPYEDVQTISTAFGFKIKELKKTVNSWVDFYKWYRKATDSSNQDEIEGYVIEDENGFMFKIKSPYYNFWKQMRGYIHTVAKGNYREIKGSKLYTPKHQKVLKFMRDIKPEKLREMNIIQIRNEYEKNVINAK